MQCLLTCPPARMPAGRTTSSISNSSSTVHSEAAGTDRPPAPPADRATYVFSTRTIYLALPPSLPGVCGLPMLLLCHQIGASPARSLPPSLALCSLARQTEKVKKEEGEKELVDQPGDGGGLARFLPAYLLAACAGGRAVVLARVARSGDVYLPKQFVNRKRGEGGGGSGGGGFLPQ